jgi:hypothetical protein
MNIPERYLYHIWDARHFIPELSTISQKQVKILFPGHFNTNVGPDYHHAVLEMNGIVKRGDIEIHLKTSDWIAHQHHEDPVYNNVILHVVFEHNSKQQFTITENGSIIDILELKCFLDHDLAKLTPPALPIPHHEPLCEFFAGLQPEQVRILLNKFGMERLERRIARFRAELHFNSIDQLIYQSFMEAMGYSQNQFPLLILAEQIPFHKLVEWKKSGMTMDEMTSIFLCSSGLINTIKQVDETHYWHNIFKKQSYFREQIPCDWNLFRIRPAHHPLKRLQWFRNFLYYSLDKKLLEQIHTVFLNHSHTSARDIENALNDLFSDESSLPSKGKGLGKNMLRLFIMNALLPIELMNAKKIKNADYILKLENLYRRYPNLPENAHIRNMKHFMTDTQIAQYKGSALRQLGLQQLYREYCMVHDCESCRKYKIEKIKHI